MKSYFKTIISPTQAQTNRKGSKHLAFAYPVNNKNEVEDLIHRLRDEHPKANHVCYAFILRSDTMEEYATDDGEPKHSGGSPILAQIKSKELQNVLVAVVRYFGGTKLGIPGLIEAYGSAAKEALEASEMETVTEKRLLKLRVPYDKEKTLKTLISKEKATIVHAEYKEWIYLHIVIEMDNFDHFNSTLYNHNLNRYVVE